jgi:hypothetical protein
MNSKPTKPRTILALTYGLGASVAAVTGSLAQEPPLNHGLLNYWSFQADYNDQAPPMFGTAGAVQDNATPGIGTSILTGGPFGPDSGFAKLNRASQPSFLTVAADPAVIPVFAQENAYSNYRLTPSGTNNHMEFVGGNGGTNTTVRNADGPAPCRTPRSPRSGIMETAEGLMISSILHPCSNSSVERLRSMIAPPILSR